MPNKKRILIASFLIAAAVLLVFMVVRLLIPQFISPRSVDPVIEDTDTAREIEAPAEPTHITIPALGIDTVIEEVGVTESGYMAVPESYKTVGWYEPGFMPGEKGNAVMTGHLDNSLGLPGVFANLEELERGDEVRVENARGETLVFVVVDTETYQFNSAPLEDIFGSSDKARLNLITCEGDWVEEIRSYDDRLIVYTELDRVE